MTPMVGLLIVLWAAVLVPVVWRVHAERQARFASSLGDGLQALEESAGVETPGVDAQLEELDERPLSSAAVLRAVLAALLLSAAISLVAALATSQRSVLAAHLFLDNCLLAFVAYLVARRDARARDRAVVPATVDPSRSPLALEADEPPLLAPRPHTPGVPVIAAPMVGRVLGPPVAPAG